MRYLMLALAACAAVLFMGRSARADGLSENETRRLFRGEPIERSQSLARGGKRYVGGVAYVVIDTAAENLTPILSDVDAWRRILPSARSARHVGSIGGDSLVEMTHGNALVHATYTMRVHRDENEVRFWMAPQRRHDIEDAWGFLRAEPLVDGRTLVTYGVLIDMGPGLLRDLFEGTVHRLALSVPERVRAFALQRAPGGGAP